MLSKGWTVKSLWLCNFKWLLYYKAGTKHKLWPLLAGAFLQTLLYAHEAPCDQPVHQEARAEHERKALLHKQVMKTLSDREEKTNYISPNIFYLETCPNPGKLGDYMKEGWLLEKQVSFIPMPVAQVWNTV